MPHCAKPHCGNEKCRCSRPVIAPRDVRGAGADQRSAPIIYLIKTCTLNFSSLNVKGLFIHPRLEHYPPEKNAAINDEILTSIGDVVHPYN